MSYILDALNKSERERIKQNDVRSLQEPTVVNVGKKRLGWVYPTSLVIAAIIASVMVGYFLAKPPTQTHITESLPSKANPEQEEVRKFKDTNLETRNSKSTDIPAATVKPSVIQASVIEPSSLKPNDLQAKTLKPETLKPGVLKPNALKSITIKPKVPHISELPRSFQNTVPDIEYSAHVYSDNGGSGFAILNGSMRYKGYRVAQDLYLKDILAEGVVLEYQGTLFRLSAMKSWHKH